MARSSAPSTDPPPARFEDTFSRRIAKLRGRILLGAILVVLVLTTLTLTLAWSQYQDGKDEALKDVRARAVLAGTVFDTFFAGQISTLESIAAAPSVTARDTEKMKDYFARVQPPKGTRFTGGLGWLDLKGIPRATSSATTSAQSFRDRSYFKRVVATGKPFVSEAIVARASQRRVVVTAVPTHDERGRLSGVLTGGFLLTPLNERRAVDLGFAGLHVIDRTGQLVTLRSLARPRNTHLLTQLRGTRAGVLADTRGLDGADGHVVGYATSAAPAWKIVIDQPASVVFAGARRTLYLESGVILATAGAMLALIGWAMLRSRRALRSGRGQIRRWGQLTRSLNGAVDAMGVGRILATSLAAEFPGAAVAVALGSDPDELRIVAVERGRSSPGRRVDENEVLRAARALYPTGAGQVGPRATTPRFHTVAVGDEAEPGGAVSLIGRDDRRLTESELVLVQLYADQATQALARVRLHERDHDTAILLQRSLLPTSLPETDGVSFGARYQAGTAYAEVGGDWYDAVRRPDGILHLSVGDVAGRGIPAAVLMGQLRNAFRAYAADHTSPAAIIERLALHIEEAQMATAVCVSFDPYTRELRYASAGHPPPLLIDADTGLVVRLDTPGIPPIGWSPRRTPEDVLVELPSRATLAMYTDGLIERRGSSLDAGVERLAASVGRRSGETLDEVTERVVDELGAKDAPDDAAILLVGIAEVPARVRIDIPAEAVVLRELRRRLRAWMTLRSVGELQGADAILAVSEACNNAIEHGYREGTGTIAVEIDHAGETLRIAVEDAGRWREPRADDTRGRGLLIMNGLMHDTRVVRGERGTRVVFEHQL